METKPKCGPHDDGWGWYRNGGKWVTDYPMQVSFRVCTICGERQMSARPGWMLNNGMLTTR